MIIEKQEDVTTAVLSEFARVENPRFREIMAAFVRHLHDFGRGGRLTGEAFRAALAAVNAIGKASNETHNEAVLMAGSLGVSALICLLNNGNKGATETDHNMLGPFWRMHSPQTPNGGPIVRLPPPGPALFVHAPFPHAQGRPIARVEAARRPPPPPG